MLIIPETEAQTLTRLQAATEKVESELDWLRFEAQTLGPVAGALQFKRLAEIQSSLNDFYRATVALLKRQYR